MKEPGLFGDSLPEGVPSELTISELEEMACRQQQQIESQRQLLAAKEQRLRFLKQHEAKHQLVATEHERLRRLRDKVETQEQKLRKLRALRGQVDQTKLNNVSLTSDLESIRALFNEKEKELSIAVAKVEELTRQLEELQRGRDANSAQMASSVAAVELEKLRAELLYRNKLNEQHTARLSHQRELLAQRQEEMTAIDRRIAELQERLHRKRLLNQQLAHHMNKQQDHDSSQKCQQQSQLYQQSTNQNQAQSKLTQSQFHQQQQQQLQQHRQQLQQQLQQHQQQLQHQLQQNYQQQKVHHMQQVQLQKHQQQQQHHQQQQQQQQQQQSHQQQQSQQLQQIQTSQPLFSQVNVANKSVQLKSNVSQGVGLIPKSSTKSSTSTNIAAVEPYHHVPSMKNNQYVPGANQDVKRNYRKSDQHSTSVVDSAFSHRTSFPPYPPTSQKEAKLLPNEERVPPYTPHTNNVPDEDRKNTEDNRKPDDNGVELWPNKFDAKYQTLPGGGTARYSHSNGANVTRYDYRRPAEGIENTLSSNSHHEASSQKFSSTDKRLTDDGFNGAKEAETNDSSGSGSATSNGDALKSPNNATALNLQSSSPMQSANIVRSVPIQTSSNKGLATPLSNSNYVPRSTATNINNFTRPYEVPPYSGYNHTSENHAVTCSNTVVTYTNTYQKPVSSVSPIYQTSSTRIQPVQPQIIGSFSLTHNQQNQESRKNYMHNDSSSNSHANSNHTSKPALPPKPAPPIKATPPPPPRQSPFHTQFVTSQSEKKNVEQRSVYAEYETDTRDENANNAEVESRLSGHDFKDQVEKKYYQRDGTDLVSELLDSNANSVRMMINVNARNGLVFNKDMSPKKSESPPPLPNVEPPSDEEVEKSMKLKTIYVQSGNDKNNNSESKDMASRLHQMSITERLMSDLSQDSSSSDTSSAENNYFVSSNRRIELPPAYLFPESGTPPRDLVGNHDEKDVDIILSMKNADQINIDTSSENEKSSPTSLSPDSDETEKMNAYNDSKQISDEIKKIKKGNLKNNNSVNSKRRVSFDPLALLLDASLEGELELVVRTAGQVKNPSAANDEGITALHNAICAGHFEIVKFLVQFGCDVNAQDSDGWTPLHCAASCNNLPMVRFLVEHGACIFATTLSDQETAAEKCEEDEEGFDGCSEFLYSVQEKLGILNNGVVYAVFDYEAHNPDELSFKEGDRLTVLRKGDEWEREWWWTRLNDKEGYIPRNLLGLYPRTHPTNKIQD